LLTSVKAKSFDDGKVGVVEDAARHGHFTSAQAAELVKQCSFGKGQSRVAIVLYPRLVDPVNFHEVLAAMTFDSHRQEVRKALGLAK
jgi:hypothetical protein